MRSIDTPFQHLTSQNFLSDSNWKALLRSVDELEWENYDRGSYKYLVSSLDYEAECYRKNQKIIDAFISDEFLKTLSRLLMVRLNRCTDFTYHKMSTGDYAQKHTDKNSFGELVRAVYYLSPLTDFEGGYLKHFSVGGNEIHKVFKMSANSLFAFRMTDDFFHEVTTVTRGTRYCITITYR